MNTNTKSNFYNCEVLINISQNFSIRYLKASPNRQLLTPYDYTINRMTLNAFDWKCSRWHTSHGHWNWTCANSAVQQTRSNNITHLPMNCNGLDSSFSQRTPSLEGSRWEVLRWPPSGLEDQGLLGNDGMEDSPLFPDSALEASPPF